MHENTHVTKQTQHQQRFSLKTWIEIVDDPLLGPILLDILGNLWYMHNGFPAVHFVVE